ncbi:hypothetical protein EV356DRAFT_571867 [Viridothelium virens]|uniref:Isopropylmalate dehydrogenase-like domain-containing protein n=1 Tax=Viridothelium virens TaxID=1048519 RepID=A0A6A6GS50_VIRVR|nr:hypothetical protein EV356DRAFT_571867 [Viridothelium virens]
MLEPVHGSAPDTGKGIANSLGALWSAAETVAWIGEKDASVKLIQAVESTVGRGIKTADLGGSHSTVAVVGEGTYLNEYGLHTLFMTESPNPTSLCNNFDEEMRQ